MAGRINDEDIALVRERARIDEIVGEYVQLRNAGGGSLKGLCPFHDERTPSFQVTPSRGLFYCFGCGEGGDVISFVEKIDNLTFVEAVQRLADKVGVQLRIVDDGRPGIEPGLRLQILEANDAAAEFYHQQVSSSEGIIARQFLDGRGFEREAAETFHIGYAPRGGHVLRDHLLAKGFSPKALVSSGLVREKGWDFFQGRVLWPIKDSGKSVLGFGARRVYDDDRLPAKYINTPETVVYKKSHVLYGLDLSRTNIGRKRQAVVMEGYTDVMAAHLSGVDTAVASCGTAFGSDHARLLQRLMGNNGALSGEVVFTFDGDAAGRKAALKVYQGDSEFVSQTYVAVEPNGLDPCDLRIQHGPEAVRELVARRIPLYRYVMDNVVHDFDLDRADGRVAAVRAAAPLVTSIRDSSLVDGYLRELSQIVGMDVDEVRREVARTRRNPAPPADLRPTLRVLPEVADPAPQAPAAPSMPWPDPADRRLAAERGLLKLLLQRPDLFDADWDLVEPADFRHPAYRAVFEAATSVPVVPEGWSQAVSEATSDPIVRQLEVALLVEPVLSAEPDARYAAAYAARVRLLSVTDDIADLKSRLQRTNPTTDRGAYNAMFADLVELEALRKELISAGSGSIEVQ
ncbi:MAG: DNA primase [Acidipropionibacterium jensenii]|nr:DNA primase [Acidipropionibacterium jensenii]MDN5977402.1 DNA primase [Acidipropionibacterium jensenii]MDN6480078.1 DNA primase [Acidipropionibacterium jensenii]QCV89052.1 DNA primase [Acidipropionibacterium jensenii]